MVEPSLKAAIVPSPPAVPSPCVDICRLNAEGLCVGCRRTLGEISEWPHASDARRLEILRELKLRTLRP
ncbi:MAG TPA: DUF1289 domain-containing protein [Steroidobacteraceae bacterium]|jgi:hypothetical protein|nr:DUF1289 domain-containing protein [Steroidobacteraceae bacterium]